MRARRERQPGGKLRRLARRWASGRGARRRSEDPATRNARLPAWMEKRDDDEEIQLFAAEAETASLFIALGTQWRLSMIGLRTGLDYNVIRATAELMGVAIDAARFHDLQLMEAAAIGAFARAVKR